MNTVLLQTQDLFGWFVQKVLDARELREKHDVLTGENAAGTMYIAGLLTHMCSQDWLKSVDHRGARLDHEVAENTSKSESPRQRMETYRTTADRYLLYLGIWDGLQGNQQGRYYQITEDNLAQRARNYYGFASDLASRLPPPSRQSAVVYQELSCHLGTYLAILLSMRGDILHLIPQVTAGEEFHLSQGSFV